MRITQLTQNSILPVSGVVLAVCCLALGGVFVRYSEVGPMATGGYRSLIAAPILGALYLTTRNRQNIKEDYQRSAQKLSIRDNILIFVGGLFLCADLCLWNISFFYTTLAESNLLANLVPFVVALYMWLLFRERPDGRLLLPSLVAISGLLMLTTASGVLHTNHIIGNALALATAFFYAAFLLITKSLRERHSALKIMTILSAWCGVGCLFVSVVARENATPESLRGWVMLLGLAVSSQLLGQTLMAHCVKYISIQLASLFILLQPVAAALYSYILFDETLTAAQALGICALLAAIYRSREIMES